MAQKRRERGHLQGEKDPALSDTEYSPSMMNILDHVYEARAANKTANRAVIVGYKALLLSERGQKATNEELGSAEYLSDFFILRRRFSSLRAGVENIRGLGALKSPTSWRPSTDDESAFLVIEFPVPWIVSGVQTSGQRFDKKKAHVTEFLLEYSLDNETWFKVGHFKNCVFECASTTQFPSVKGCYFKFTVEAWVEDVSLNASLFGYPSYNDQLDYLTEKHKTRQVVFKALEDVVESYERGLTGEDKGTLQSEPNPFSSARSAASTI